MRITSLFTKAAVLGGVGLMAFGATAQASPYTINLISDAGQLSSGLFLYQVELTANESLVAGDFISIFDFGTFTDASSTLPGFIFTNPNQSPIALSGPNPGLATPPPPGADDAGVGNLLATYEGATVTGGSFTIQATSPFTGVRADSTYGQTSDLRGVISGKVNTVTPLGVPNQENVIPEPGTMALLATGVLPLAGAVIRRRRSNK